MVAPNDQDLHPLAMLSLRLLHEPVELFVGEPDEVGAEGTALEEVAAEEDVVDARLDDGVHRLGEGDGEGPPPVLGYGEGYAAAYVGVGEDGKPHLMNSL